MHVSPGSCFTSAQCIELGCWQDSAASCRQRESEVEEWMETASQSDRGVEEAQAKSNQVKLTD